MNKIKRKATVKQSIALLLFFALAFGVTATAAGLFASTHSAEGGVDSPWIDQIGTETTNGSNDLPPTPESTDQPDDPDNPGVIAGYVQNLRDAFHTGLIRGYTENRATVSLSDRVQLHQLLTAAIETTDGDLTPILYKSYSADSHKLVKRLQLDYDYVSGTETIIRYSKQYNNKDASYLTVATPYLIGRKTVQSYMGYLIISRVELRQVEVILPPATTDEPSTLPPVTTDEPITEVLPATSEPVITGPATNEPSTAPAVTDKPISTEPTTTIPLTSETLPQTAPAIEEEQSTASTPSAALSQTDDAEDEIVYETVEVTVLSIYDRNGKLLVDDIGTKEPYYARDYSNRPVFKDADGNLFAFDGKNFLATDKGNLRSELFYDYPAYPLGEYKSVYEAHYNPETGYYEFINYKNGKKVINDQYLFAFNFGTEGYAVIGSEYNNVLKVINRQKRVMFNAGSNYVFYRDPNTGKKQYVRDYFYLPDTFGLESIGCAGFDNGYLRIRIKTLSKMSDALNAVVKDEYYLVNKSGKKFSIPEGYTLEGYSDGVLLLSKDGLYGYYSIEGKWIAQPIYSYARPFVQGLAVVGSKDGTVGMIDTTGNIVLPFVYTSIEDVSSGLIVTYCEGIGYETYEMIAK
ncbi:MAG: WG repeat-containing protein [Clostridia bacterium]|nr:WG repeat-containing protein [Clostridia bacterium]